MSEEVANCPLCKNPQVEMLNEHSTPVGAYCCGVRCDSAEKWNQYAAAMELAKTIVESENCKAEDEYKYQEFVEWARQYVLEVFK